MKIPHKTKMVVVAAAVLATAGYAISNKLTERKYTSVQKCPVEVAFIDTSTTNIEGPLVLQYCNKDGFLKKELIRDYRSDNDKILGYSRRYKSWVVQVSSVGYNRRILLVRRADGKITELKPKVQGVMTYANDLLYEAVKTDTQQTELAYDLGVKCYTLDGKLKYQQAFHLPKMTVIESDEEISVSRDSLIATTAEIKEDPCTQLFLFDSQGVLLKKLGRGSSPMFDPEGHQLAYYDSWTRRVSESIHKGQGNHRLIIYNVKTGNRRYLNLARQGDTPYQCKWSPDGKWLVCGYNWQKSIVVAPEWALYAVNITGNELKWYKYRCNVETVEWVPVDTTPIKGEKQ